MKSFQKKKVGQVVKFRSPDWFKGKSLTQKQLFKIKPIFFRGTQHRG